MLACVSLWSSLWCHNVCQCTKWPVIAKVNSGGRPVLKTPRGPFSESPCPARAEGDVPCFWRTVRGNSALRLSFCLFVFMACLFFFLRIWCDGTHLHSWWVINRTSYAFAVFCLSRAIFSDKWICCCTSLVQPLENYWINIFANVDPKFFLLNIF